MGIRQTVGISNPASQPPALPGGEKQGRSLHMMPPSRAGLSVTFVLRNSQYPVSRWERVLVMIPFEFFRQQCHDVHGICRCDHYGNSHADIAA